MMINSKILNTTKMPDTTVKIEDYMQELEKPQPDIMQEWQTSKKPVYDIIMSRYPKPEKEIDPETERRAKFAGSLSDGLVSIGEMFAHGSGARVKSRAVQPTSTGTTNASLKAAEDKYAAKLERYQAADSNAKLQDLNTYLSQDQQNRKEKREFFLYKNEQEAKAAEKAAKAAIDARDYKFKEDRAKKEDEYRDKQLKISASKASGSKPDKFEGIVINANDADGKAIVDAMGKKVIPYKMTKPQIINLANAARKDENFLTENPKASVNTVDELTGKEVRGFTNDENLAQMYAQWQYDKQYKKPQVAPDTKQFMPWLPKVNEQPATAQKPATNNKQQTTTNDPFAKYGGRTIK